MPAKKIVSVACEIPGGFSEFIPFTSKASLLDADIVLFDPDLGDLRFGYETYQGKSSLTDSQSFRLQEAADHWRSELSEAYRAGKTIFVLLRDLQEVFVDTGQREYSGTGRNRQTTRIVAPFKNYAVLPLDLRVTVSHGKAMKLTEHGGILQDYWREFGAASEFRVLLSGKVGKPTFVTKSGQKAVGTALLDRETGGAIFLLPYLELTPDAFLTEVPVTPEQFENPEGLAEEVAGESTSGNGPLHDEEDEEDVEMVWTDTAVRFGGRLAHCLVEIDKALKSSAIATPAPEWTNSAVFSLPGEAELRSQILRIEADLEQLRTRKEKVRRELAATATLRHLLYEKGFPLEAAIRRALELLGFKAEPFRDSESEFDVVFVSSEGRFLGEAEGKDNKAIGIDKLRQLQMNIHEDFDRPETNEMAKAVLFGNAERLMPLSERGDFFTSKCLAAAARSGVALVRIPDLFQVARYLSGTMDSSFAEQCRRAILSCEGKVVAFPTPPVSETEGASSEQQQLRNGAT